MIVSTLIAASVATQPVPAPQPMAAPAPAADKKMACCEKMAKGEGCACCKDMSDARSAPADKAAEAPHQH